MIIRPAPLFPQHYPINNSRPRNAGEFTADGALLPAAIALAEVRRPVHRGKGDHEVRGTAHVASPGRRPRPQAKSAMPSA